MKVFDYEDVQLIPNKCIVNSRSECDTTVILGKHAFKMPIVPANMQTIINESIAEFLAENGYFYIMHRFNGSARIPFVKKMKERQWISSISVGVKKEEYLFIEELAKQGLTPDYITIDIAHGHSSSVIEMIQRIKTRFPETFVIAGNVGIGPGKVCITKIKTGFGTGGWQLAALRWCAKAARKPIIADGGIRTHGDIAKSIRFGATMVMIGSLFAGHEESSGETKIENGIAYKEYFGSASEFQKGEKKNIEGKKIWIQHKGSLKDTLIEMHQDLQSSISYAGGRDLEAIRKVDYVIVKNSIFNGDAI
ncbi:GMP reductase [Helicobacter pylori]|uniref:GMP reductase n=1 Tax=Helicobacter pylori TaxID=210 RepID=UPI0024BB7000|nr:GMP reductase [Helicobacter pylori]